MNSIALNQSIPRTKLKQRCMCYVAALILLTTVGCGQSVHQDIDPYENRNRSVHAFNTRLDKFILLPTASLYTAITPSSFRYSVGNFFDNLAMLPTVANDVLQAELGQAVRDTFRFGINTTAGVFGLFDVATHMGLAKNYQDFGLTLAKWGMIESTYSVIPLLGPSTVRDTVAMPVNIVLSAYWLFETKVSFALTGLYYIHKRAVLMEAEATLASMVVDPYVFQRDAYLQYRNAQIRGDNEVDDDPFVEE